MRRPLIIYVSGAPGAGKTSLAKLISAELYIPHISSDLIHGGVHFTEGKAHDRKSSLHHAFVPLLINAAKSNVSLVVDHVLQRNLSETDIISRIKPYAQIIYIHVMADDAVDRFYEREILRTDKGVVLTPDQLTKRRDFHRKNLQNTSMPLELGVPCLVVNTNSDYKPNFDKIIQFIENEYKKED